MSQIKSFLRLLALIAAGAMLGCSITEAADAGKGIFYVGTYTGAKSKGIYAFQMDFKSGALTSLGLVAETPNPTFLDIDPYGKFLYAANEIGNFEGKHTGSVSAYAIEAGTGKLTLVNRVSTVGTGPCHVLIDRTGKAALVANYGSGSAAVLPIENDGSLGKASAFAQHEGMSVNAQRQERAHAHCVTLDAANQFAFVCDLGIDKIMAYHFDAAHGTLTPNETPFTPITPGSGPRHMAFSRDGRTAYLISELTSAVTVFSYDAKYGTLNELQTLSTLPADFKGEDISAEIVIAPSGKFLYASNRGHDSIAMFRIDPRKGTLTALGNQPTLGRTPRSFTFDPTGKFVIVADQDSNKLVVFTFDPKTGFLDPAGQEAETPAPVCVKFLKVRQ